MGHARIFKRGDGTVELLKSDLATKRGSRQKLADRLAAAENLLAPGQPVFGTGNDDVAETTLGKMLMELTSCDERIRRAG